MKYQIQELIKSNRKTISIQVNEDGKLIIKAPKKISHSEIDLLIQKHHSWIEKRITYYENNKINKKEFKENQEFLFMGNAYFLKFDSNYSSPYIFEDNIFLSPKYDENWLNIFEIWYKQEARKIFNQRAIIFAKLMGLKYKSIKLSSAKTRWGSCSSLGNINLAWRLIMSPLEIIDYVIVHELAHLKQANHSQKFWNEVGFVLPDYKNRRNWLKENGHFLRLH